MDTLSSEYGWTFEYVLDYIHIGDILGFLRAIERRKKSDALLSLAIAHNPFSKDPNHLFKQLRKTEVEVEYSDTIDRGSIDRLKRELAKSKVIKVKK